MLAQNFKSAAELGIAEAEHQALITVLGMLERGELKDIGQSDNCHRGDKLFTMDSCGSGCGTAACIGGWVAALTGHIKKQYEYVHNYQHVGPLCDLYWNEQAIDSNATVTQAAVALRSFLVTGDANWSEALG